MPIEVIQELEEKLLSIRITGKLDKSDYSGFLPVVEDAIRKSGKLRMLIDMHDFHGWTPAAMWEDFKFDVKHFRDLERVAIVGESKWQQWATAFAQPFTAATMRYFPREQLAEAAAWVKSA